MYSKEVFEVLEVFKDFMNSKGSKLNTNDIKCIKLFEDSVKIEFRSLNHNQMFVVAKHFAEMMRCANCRYEIIPDDEDNCVDFELSVGRNIPIAITVGIHSITLMIV